MTTKNINSYSNSIQPCKSTSIGQLFLQGGMTRKTGKFARAYDHFYGYPIKHVNMDTHACETSGCPGKRNLGVPGIPGRVP